MNPIHHNYQDESKDTPLQDLEFRAKGNESSKRKEQFAQVPIPWAKKEHWFDPTFFKTDGKIVKYEPKDLKVWGALVSFSHTILSDWDTWNHLTMLTIICFITMAIVVGTGNYKSINDGNAVATKIQTLISFVFAGYISLVINRWDRIRNTTLAQIWGAIENLNMFACRSLVPVNEETDRFKDLILRLCRLSFQLTFLAVQGDNELSHLVANGLLTEKEKLWLDEATIGTRALVVVDWIYAYFDTIRDKYRYSDPMEVQIHTNIQNLRGGIGATLGAIGAQLPYPYVHCVYWTIQILLLSLAIETGVWLATDIYMKSNGDGEWSPPDDTVSWPENPKVWYANAFLQIVASNVVFALFCEGMLKICDKLANPMSKDDTSFSEIVFDAFMHNNCRALRVGFTSFHEVFAEDIAILQRK